MLTIKEHHNYLPEENFIVGVASVACVVSHRYPIFMVFGIIKEYCRRLLVLRLTHIYIPSVRLTHIESLTLGM